MAVKDMPAELHDARVIRPDPDEAHLAEPGTLTEAFFNDPAGTDLSKIFATKLELTCAG